jgi:hypothetical protein
VSHDGTGMNTKCCGLQLVTGSKCVCVALFYCYHYSLRYSTLFLLYTYSVLDVYYLGNIIRCACLFLLVVIREGIDLAVVSGWLWNVPCQK